MMLPFRQIAIIGIVAALLGFSGTYAYDRVVDRSAKTGRTVLLRADGAVPAFLAATVGQKVTFASRDGKYHIIRQVFGDDLAQHNHSELGYSSGIFGPDEAYEVVFLKDGVFNFHDHLNPSITVRVEVAPRASE